MWVIVDECDNLDGYVLNEEECSGEEGRCVYRLFDNQLDAAKHALGTFGLSPNARVVEVNITRTDNGEIKF
jgi:hypothetical protein